MWADPGVTRYIGGVPSTREEVWSRMLRYAGLWKWLGYGYWVIEGKDSGSFVGEVGFADFKREIQPSLEGIPELGWALASTFHGKGLATEAVLAVLQWGDAHLDQNQTACIISPENKPSLRVAAKAGYAQVQLTTYKGKETVMHFRDRTTSAWFDTIFA
jgi:RimJ/RimL family protein N-acetyltransferase